MARRITTELQRHTISTQGYRGQKSIHLTQLGSQGAARKRWLLPQILKSTQEFSGRGKDMAAISPETGQVIRTLQVILIKPCSIDVR